MDDDDDDDGDDDGDGCIHTSNTRRTLTIMFVMDDDDSDGCIHASNTLIIIFVVDEPSRIKMQGALIGLGIAQEP